MKKKIIWTVLIFFSLIVALVLFILIEDLTYDKSETDPKLDDPRTALVLAWETNDQRAFWNDYTQYLHPVIVNWHQKQRVNQVLPFEHKPLSYKDGQRHWTNCVVLMLTDEQYNPEIPASLVSAIEGSSLSESFCSLDLMKLQPGLGMVYPLKNGIERAPTMHQTIEYVFSNPAAREEYYQDQYRFSGPAMQDLHSRDKAGRFIGFELEKRIFASKNMPQWDVIHIMGFTTWQEIKAVPFFYQTWNKHAERAYGEGMTLKKKLAEWNKIRTNVKSATKQNFSMTLTKN
ncbi:MAG: hypothetical protein AAF944_23275 [Bacteroidota bacterium]